MPRLIETLPKYRKHRASGQAVVTINGGDNYLGPHGTKASKHQYDWLVSEYLASGRSIAFGAPAHDLTVVELAADYLGYAKGYFGIGDNCKYHRILDQMRQKFKAQGLTRSQANESSWAAMLEKFPRPGAAAPAAAAVAADDAELSEFKSLISELSPKSHGLDDKTFGDIVWAHSYVFVPGGRKFEQEPPSELAVKLLKWMHKHYDENCCSTDRYGKIFDEEIKSLLYFRMIDQGIEMASGPDDLCETDEEAEGESEEKAEPVAAE